MQSLDIYLYICPLVIAGTKIFIVVVRELKLLWTLIMTA